MTETVSRPTEHGFPTERGAASASEHNGSREQDGVQSQAQAAVAMANGQSESEHTEHEEDVFVFPASFAQQRLWFLDQFEPNSPFYNIATAVRLRGPLQAPVLERTLNEIVRRHESLRTTFTTVEDQPVQVIRPEWHLKVPLVDISSLPEAEREAEAQRLGNQEAQTPFNLTRGPLVRAKLLRLGPQDHVALLTMHHIISDGWSMGVLVREIVAIYTAFEAGRASPLPDLPIQYADFAQWQRDWLQGEVLQGQIDYWKTQLGDQPPVLELPSDRPRLAVQSSRGGSASLKLDQSLVDALGALSQREGATMFMTLLAAFQVLLSRYSGQEDICVGSPIANRTRGELEGLIGFFVNTLVLRTNLAGDPTFREVLQRVREMALGAYAHQDLPFEMLVETLQPERDMSHTPLFQVMFILQNAAPRSVGGPRDVGMRGAGMQHAGGNGGAPGALKMSMMTTETGTSTFDLTLSMAQAEDGLAASMEYSTDLYDHDSIVRMLGHLETLLRGIVADPGRRISTLPLLTKAEVHQVVVAWNDTERVYAAPTVAAGTEQARRLLVHELFDAQAKRTPDAIAVVYPAVGGPAHSGGAGRRLTYRELAERSDRLAGMLVGLGVGPEALVGLCFERSPEMLVGVLGVLKAGGAYVPLDPSYPKDRLAMMLDDAQVEVLVIQRRLLEAIPQPGPGLATHNSCVVLLDADQEPAVQGPVPVGLPSDQPEAGSTENLGQARRALPGPDNLAYLIFTSGSTGRPKGVMIEHGSIRNAYLAWEEAYELRSVRAHLQMASFSFDVFTGDWVRALCSGGKLVLAPRELLLEPKALYDLMRREEIDCAEFVPVVLRSLMQYLAQTGQRLDFMRLVTCGSDSWYVGEYREFQGLCGPRTRLVNSFGLTEATIDSTYFDGDTTGLSDDQLVPIGRPFGNNQIFILDRQMQPVPIGVPGELYVGGLGLARGYLVASNGGAGDVAGAAGNGSGPHKREARLRAAHTGERFIPNPLIAHAEADSRLSPRLYRTGDGARYRRDGNIEFLGRIDDQVKIRGYRIELGEIEAVLNQHPDLQQSAAVAREDRPGSKRLVSYVVPLRAPAPGASVLRRFMQERLPDYMVPSLFIVVSSLPVTPNGKIDRRALAALPLPPMEEIDRGAEEEYVAPRTPTERALAGMWADVLDMPADTIGVHDNFFSLGGHSLLATQIVSRVRDEWQIDLPLRSIFEAPVLAALAEQIEVRAQQSAAQPVRQAPPILPVLRTTDLPLSFAQQRLWFLDQLEPNSPFYNMPEVVRLSGKLDRNILEQSLNEIMRRHESLRTTFLTVDGKPQQVISPMAPFHLQVIDLRSLPAHERDAEVERIVKQESQQPFNLAHGPLWRVRLLRLDEEEHIFLMVIHHIISDDWSSNVLFGEIATFYDAFSRGGSWPLPDLAIQYADYAVWQREWLQGDTLHAHLAYWEDQLKGVPPLLEMPTDRPRPAMQTFAGDYQSFSLSEDLSAGLKAVSQRAGVTLFMTLLSAFQVLLSRYSGQEDICVGSPIANRTQSELEALIGFFVNTLVLRGDLSGDPTFRQLLQRTRETALGAYAHQDLPFEMIVDKVQPQRDMSHSPLFQAMFVLRSAGMQSALLRNSSMPNSPLRSQELNNLTLCPVEAHSGTAKFDLTLFMVEEGARLSGALEYNTDLFDATTMRRMLDHWQNLLQGIVADPGQHISHLPVLGERERQQLLVEWNDTAHPYPQVCAHHLFEAQVAKTPDAIAITEAFDPLTGEGEKVLTYRELNRRANQLARYLQSQGVGPDVLVGVCARRSLELPVALLGILKAGGAYVPLDPTYPQERLAFMLEDSQVPILLTQTSLLEQLPAQYSVAQYPGHANSRVVCLDTIWPGTAQPGRSAGGDAPGASFDDQNPASDVTPDHLAYMIYTSGSTGKPKGAMIVHRGLVNYLTWCLQAYPLLEGQGAPVHSSISFDLTVTSLFAPLVSGRRVKLLPEHLGVEALAEALRQDGNYSLVKITPAHLELLGQQLDSSQAAGRTRSFIIGGENLLVEHIAFWQSFAPETMLVNEYGPTETVVGCCVYTVPGGEETPQAGSIPIGRPIINTQLYVLDRHLQPVPIGVVGELYIGGAGVARGYLNRPELTAERFIPDPFSGASRSPGELSEAEHEPRGMAGATGARLYKTGDLARYRSDGNLECLGRIDHQVKIRGFRVELGEIEAVLSQYPSLREVCVLAREDAPGVRRLVAYVSTRSAPGPDPAPTANAAAAHEVKAFLASKLPEYMVPSAIVFLEALPLTSNGKVDRRALPAPEAMRPDLKADYVAPRNGDEEALARIWSEVLHLERVGIYDSFFELGGDSILSIQVIARANQAGLRLTPKDLFQHPTIEGLATAAMTSSTADAIQAEQGIVAGDVPLTPIQHWLLEQELVELNHWNQALLLESHQRLDRALLERAIEQLLQHHDALRLRFVRRDDPRRDDPRREGDGWEQTNADREEGPVFSWVDISAMSRKRQQAAIEAQAAALQASLNISQGPLVRIAYFDLGAQQPARLLIAVHHLAMDGVSWGVLLGDLQLAYQQLARHEAVQLLPKTTSFRYWANKLVQHASSAALQQEAAYWRKAAAGPVAPLPIDNPRGASAEGRTRSITTSLDAQDTWALLHNVHDAYHTEINDILLTALAQVLARWTHGSTVAIDLEGHGREQLFDDVDLSRTVGWFTNLYPVYITLGNVNDPGDCLKAVKETLRRIPQHGMGWGLLRYLGPAETRDALRTLPRAGISFNYLGQVDLAGQMDQLLGETLLAPAAESRGADRGPGNRRTHLVDVNGGVASGCLHLEWSYSEDQYRRATIEALAADYRKALQELIAHCQSVDAGGFTPSDMADFGWGEEELDDILRELGDVDQDLRELGDDLKDALGDLGR